MSNDPGHSFVLGDLRVLELGDSLAASVCGRLFAELGAEVLQVRLPEDARTAESSEARDARVVIDALKCDVSEDDLAELAARADLIILGGSPGVLERHGWTPERLRESAPNAVILAVTPFGWEGPYRDWHATDLTLFHISGMARLLLGAVEDPRAQPPVRAAGEQSAFIAGVAAATAAMPALYRRARSGAGAVIDLSMHEALASMAARELASPALGIVPSSRTRRGDVLGASVVLPASDGWVTVSPREAHQWRAWVEVMGSPAWASEPRFATNDERLKHAGELIALMSAWTRERTRAEIYAATQAGHVPCLPSNGPGEVLQDEHLRLRDAFAPVAGEDGIVGPVPPFGLGAARLRSEPPSRAFSPAPAWPKPAESEVGLPLAGVRVLDFSWVIAGPTATQYLASFGAEIVKIESPDRPDPGRRTALHDVLGRSKLNLGLNLKAPGAIDAVHAIAAECDIVIENFASGVMDRLGLGEDILRRLSPDLVYVSSSGLGRTGPQAEAVAYGTLIQCFVGFAELNGFPGYAPSTGFAWSDPLCGMLLAFSSTAALYARARGRAPLHAIDHSMAEALLWTMPGTLVEVQRGEEPPRQLGNRSRDFVPHDAYPALGDDRWIAIAVTTDEEWRALCGEIPSLRGLEGLDVEARRGRIEEIDAHITAWTEARDALATMRQLQAAGVPTGATFDTQMLFEDEHLWAREFYQPVVTPKGDTQMLPRTPWRWPDGMRPFDAATPIGADNVEVLERIARLTPEAIDALAANGALAAD